MIVVTGGKKPGDRITQGLTGFDYLRGRGIPEDAIKVEVEGTNSYEELSAAALIIRQAGLDPEVVVVSDPYHSMRISQIAEQVGLTPHLSPDNTSSPLRSLARRRRPSRPVASSAIDACRACSTISVSVEVPGVGRVRSPLGAHLRGWCNGNTAGSDPAFGVRVLPPSDEHDDGGRQVERSIPGRPTTATMPAGGAPTSAAGWPGRARDNWRLGAEPAQRTFAAVAGHRRRRAGHRRRLPRQVAGPRPAPARGRRGRDRHRRRLDA